jgi:hypothetical protein
MSEQRPRPDPDKEPADRRAEIREKQQRSKRRLMRGGRWWMRQAMSEEPETQRIPRHD